MNLLTFLKTNTKTKVGLFIIGAQKCGTTSLHNYLCQHSKILGSRPKEVDFFSYNKNYSNGPNWYHKHFNYDKVMGNKFLLDSSVEYLYMPFAWKRLLKYNPNAKIIVCLRNPIERALSAYFMYMRLWNGEGFNYYAKHLEGQTSYLKKQMLNLIDGNEFLTFEQYVDIEIKMMKESHSDFRYEPSFLGRGFYFNQLKPFYDNFDHKNIFIVDSEEFKSSKVRIVKQILAWLNLGFETHIELDENHLKGVYKKNIDKELNERLKTLYKLPNKELFKLINKDLNWNN